jgi:hypothetical protein
LVDATYLAIIKLDFRFAPQANDSGSKAFEGSYSQTILSHNSIFKEQSKQPNAVWKKILIGNFKAETKSRSQTLETTKLRAVNLTERQHNNRCS